MAWTAEIVSVAPSETSELIVVTIEFSDGDQLSFRKSYNYGRYYKPTPEELAAKIELELQAFKELREWADTIVQNQGYKVEYGKSRPAMRRPSLDENSTVTVLTGE